jgi:ABC-type sugar transport system, periplasmic component
MPFLADAYGLYYNKKMFAAAGIANPPKTFSELARTPGS